MRKIFMLFFVSLMLYARENPFMAVKNIDEKNIQSTNIINQYPEFISQSFSLPDNARVIKHVIIAYQIIDGSIKNKMIKIDGKFDWHDELILTSKSAQIAPILDANITQEEEVKNEAKQEIKPEPIRGVVISPKDEKKHEIKELEKSKELIKLSDFFSFNIDDNRSFTMYSKDKLLRHFVVRKPYKVAFDFASLASFYTKTKKIYFAPFVKVELGSHNGFYRVTFEFDGPYPYEVDVKEDFTYKVRLY